MLFVTPSLAFAQNQVAIETIEVNFWPEFDRGDMLVINYITLTPDTTLPATFNLRIPAQGSLNAVAVGPTLEMVSDQGVKYTTSQEGDWQVVSVEAAGPALLIEYYDPSLKKNGSSRSYSYQWLSDHKVKKFNVVVQQPFDASDITSSVDLQDQGTGQNGLQYFGSDIGTLESGKTFSFDLGYKKTSNALSVSQLQEKVQPAAPLDDKATGMVSFSNSLPYVFGGVGLLLIIGGVAYFLQAGKSSNAKPRRRTQVRADNEGDVYCSQCGARARGGDRFCRTCGSRIRQSEE
jgi:hypothetical protein